MILPQDLPPLQADLYFTHRISSRECSFHKGLVGGNSIKTISHNGRTERCPSEKLSNDKSQHAGSDEQQ